MIDFVALGQQHVPAVPDLRCVPLAQPHAQALYERRLEAMRSSTEPWLCFVDGGPDGVGEDFVPAMHALAGRAEDEGVQIGYAAETIRGKLGMCRPFTLREFLLNHQVIHHGVVCRVEALRAIDWPEGCHVWEMIAYGVLAQRGFVYDPLPRYDWRPDKYGARCWPSYQRAVVNSRMWLRDQQ